MSLHSVRKYKEVNKIQHNSIDLTEMRDPPNSCCDPEQPAQHRLLWKALSIRKSKETTEVNIILSVV